MDPTIWVAIVTTIGVVCAALIAGFFARSTNAAERKRAAEQAAELAAEEVWKEKEAVLRERLVLKEEQNADLQRKIEQLKIVIAELEAVIDIKALHGKQD